jgi:DmsE family decaheme c-type cytochrome
MALEKGAVMGGEALTINLCLSSCCRPLCNGRYKDVYGKFFRIALGLSLLFSFGATLASDPNNAPNAAIAPKDCVTCHAEQFKSIKLTRHGDENDARTPYAAYQCQSCHGDSSEHLDTQGEALETLIRFKPSAKTPTRQKDAVCLDCHQGGERIHWQGSAHESNDLSCTSCHSVHRRDKILAKGAEANVCFRCHKDIKTDYLRPYAHPSDDKINCRDCHNVHGSMAPKSLKGNEINQACYDCHAEKRGPFLWEHPTASEDCTHCHRAHGSNHASLLKSRPPFLCQKCHQNESGSRHIRRVMDLDSLGTGGRTRFIVGSSCMNCHPKVHGSNHPSGVSLSR